VGACNGLTVKHSRLECQQVSPAHYVVEILRMVLEASSWQSIKQCICECMCWRAETHCMIQHPATTQSAFVCVCALDGSKGH
jgi:hypothetical protein